jgi:hypothetical protein
MNRQSKPTRPQLRYGDALTEHDSPEFVDWVGEVERAIGGAPLVLPPAKPPSIKPPTVKPKQRPVLRLDMPADAAQRQAASFDARDPDEIAVEEFQQELARRRAERDQAQAATAQRIEAEGRQYGTARRLAGKLVQPVAEIGAGIYSLPATMLRSNPNVDRGIVEDALGAYGESVDALTTGLRDERARLAALPADAGGIERGANFAANLIGEAGPVVAGVFAGGAPWAVAAGTKFAQTLGQGRTPVDAAREGAFAGAGTFVGGQAGNLARGVAPAVTSSGFGQRLVSGGVAGAAGGGAALGEGALRDEDPELTEWRAVVQAAISAALAGSKRPYLDYDMRAPTIKPPASALRTGATSGQRPTLKFEDASTNRPATNGPTFRQAARNFFDDQEGSPSFSHAAQNLKAAAFPQRNTAQHASEPKRWNNEVVSAVKAAKARKSLSVDDEAELKQIYQDGMDALKNGDGGAYIRAREAAVGILGKDASVKEKLLDVANVPRSMLASLDLSFPLRQGGLGLLNLSNLSPARAKARVAEFRDMMTSAVSQRGFDDIRAELRGHPRAPLAEAAGLYSATDSALKINHSVLDREEFFASELAEKIPLVGRGVKASDRAFVAAGDLQRLHLFNGFADQLEKRGVRFADNPKAYQDVARFVNAMTGRGEIHDKLKSLEPVLSAGMFSPKFLASRLQVLNPATYARMEPEARRIALKEVAGFVGLGFQFVMLLSKIVVGLHTYSLCVKSSVAAECNCGSCLRVTSVLH